MHTKRAVLARVLRLTTFEPNTGCWLWTGAITKKGYGRYKAYSNRLVFVHRISYQETFGRIPQGLFVLHKCDQPLCVNPDHLFLGTIADNNRDCEEKRRRPKGEHIPNHKLTDEIVRKIRASSDSPKSLGIRYGVTPDRINKIRARKAWKHVE